MKKRLKSIDNFLKENQPLSVTELSMTHAGAVGFTMGTDGTGSVNAGGIPQDTDHWTDKYHGGPKTVYHTTQNYSVQP